MAQRTRKVLLWDGSYTEDGAFGDCNAKNKQPATSSKDLLVAPNVGVQLVVPKVGARIVEVGRFLDIDRKGRKPNAYAAIAVDLKGIAAIKSLLLVVYPRAGAGGVAKPVYRELITGNDKILALIAGKTHPKDAEPTLPKPPRSPVKARYRDTPFTVKVWVSTLEKLDVDALELDERVFATPEVLPLEEKFPKLAHDKSLPHQDNYHSEKKKTYEVKRRETAKSWLGHNQISCPLHEDLKLVFIKTTHTAALPALDRGGVAVAKNVADLTRKKTRERVEQVEKEVAEARESAARLRKELPALVEQERVKAEELKQLKAVADPKIKESVAAQLKAKQKGDGLAKATEPSEITEREEADREAERLRLAIIDLRAPILEKDAEVQKVRAEIEKVRNQIAAQDELADQPTPDEVTPTDTDYFIAHPDEYTLAVKSYLDGIEDRSAAAFDHHVLRKVPMSGECPACTTATAKLFCQHRLELERFTRGSDSPEPCVRSSLTKAQKLNDPPDTIGDGGTTRTSFDDFMAVFCDHDGGQAGALSPIDGLLVTITDDNYAHNVAAAAAYKALLQRGAPGEKRLVINFDQHIDCGDNKFIVDEEGQVKITCATWGQFMYYASPDPGDQAHKLKLKTPWAPKDKPIAHGYVAVGTLISSTTPSVRQTQMRDYRAIPETGALPGDDGLHELVVNPAAAVLRRSDGTPGGARTVKTFGEKTFKGAKGKLFQLCDYRDLLAGANPDDDKDPDGVPRAYVCPKCPGSVPMTPVVESPKTLSCARCGATESRQGLEDVYFDGMAGETDWSKWHVFITIDRDFFIGNGTGWNDGRNGSHKGRDLVLKCLKYLVDKKAKIVGFDICGVPDKKGVASSKFFGGREYEAVYSQLAEDVRTFCLQLDEMMYAAEEKRAMELLGCDATWKIESWIPKLAGATGAPPARNAENVLRHEGLYVHFIEGSSSKSLLRFYPDGKVIAAAVEASAELPTVAKWFHRDNRAVTVNAFALEGAALTFSSKSQVEKPIDYKGTIEGNTLVMKVHSQINDRSFDETFHFTRVPLA